MNKTNEIMDKMNIDVETIKKEAEQGFAGYKEITLEALKDYRRGFSEESQLQDIEKIKQIDEAISFLEGE